MSERGTVTAWSIGSTSSSSAPARRGRRRRTRRGSSAPAWRSSNATCSAVPVRTGAASRPSRCSTAPLRHALGADYPWTRASERRDYMINRVGRDYPDDTGHVRRSGGRRGDRHPWRRPGSTAQAGSWSRRPSPAALRSRGSLGARGRRRHHRRRAPSSKVPPVEGIETIRTWTNRDATSARQLPRSLLVLGGGPTGVELAQVYARFGVPDDHRPVRRAARPDRPPAQLARRRVVRWSATASPSAWACAPSAHERLRALTARTSSSSTTAPRAEGHAQLLAVGRTFPLDGLGLESVGLVAHVTLPHDGRLRIGDGL